MKRKQLLSALLGAAAGLVMAGEASAVVIVPTFNYDLTAGWVVNATTPTCDGGGVGTGCVTPSGDSYTINGTTVRNTISWPDGSTAQSSLSLDVNFGTAGNQSQILGGSLPGNGTPIDGTLVIHANNPVPLGDNLQDASLLERLTLSAPGVTITDPTRDLQFFIHFQETPNVPGPGGCEAGGLEPCQDIFLLLNPDELTTLYEVCDGSGDCSNYLLTLSTALLNILPVADFQALFPLVTLPGGLGPNIGYLLTQEVGNNDFLFKAKIGLVPEPSVLALMGIGLLGLGLSWRRQKAA